MISHRRAVFTMILVTFLWSLAGVVTRRLEGAAPFELSFWRSASNALALTALLTWLMGPRSLLRRLCEPDRVLWVSGLCWAVMFTAFMLALTLTTVANVLITMALGPMFTALIARLMLRQSLPLRTWLTLAVAGAGIAWIFGAQVTTASVRDAWGTLLAFSVPVASASMWVLLQINARRAGQQVLHQGAALADMRPAVLIGAVLSALVCLPLAQPIQASLHDIGWLAFLGVFQLAIPCVLAVAAGKVLKAPEASLLGLLEVIFGVAWAGWLGGETPGTAVLGGGAVVLCALAANELWALRRPMA